jgi:hypothetical protein
MVIHPYKYDEMWVFDDEKVGLIQEPFVSGADEIIERMVTQIPNAESGFSLIFSGSPFPGYQLKFDVGIVGVMTGAWEHNGYAQTVIDRAVLDICT